MGDWAAQVVDLKELARHRNLAGYSKMKKGQLVDALAALDVGPADLALAGLSDTPID